MAKMREQRIRARKAKARKRRVIALTAIIVVVVALVLIYQFGHAPPASKLPSKVLLRTSMGDITIELYDDMPITTGNFKNLVKQGVYDGTIFHRVIDEFMIQGGDPTGTGYGDPSIPTIQDEFTDHNRNERGTIAMANKPDQPNSGSSQFFINLVYNEDLDSKHPVFGKVISGMQVVDAIGKVETDKTTNRPLQPVTIISAELLT